LLFFFFGMVVEPVSVMSVM